jgi:hypothetical protein
MVITFYSLHSLARVFEDIPEKYACLQEHRVFLTWFTRQKRDISLSGTPHQNNQPNKET